MGTKLLLPVAAGIFVVLGYSDLGTAKPYSTIGVGNGYKIEPRSPQFSLPFGIKFVTRNANRRPTLPNPMQSASSTLKPRFYILRKKPTKQQQPIRQQQPVRQEPKVTYTYYRTGAGDINTFDDYSPSFIPETHDIRRIDAPSTLEQQQPQPEASEWISLDEVANAFSMSPEKLDNTPIYTDTPSNSDTFQSNIPLPHNPFLSLEASRRSNLESTSYTDDSLAIPQIDLTQQQSTFPAEPNPDPEQSLQKVLNKYLRDLYKSKGSEDAPPTASELLYTPEETSSSRLDNFRYFHVPSPQIQTSSPAASQDIPQTSSSTHYTKPGSSTSFIPISVENSATAPEPHEKVQAHVVQQAQSRESTGHTDYPQTIRDPYQTKIKRLQHLSEVFPPQGSYTPYGEQTIVMLKYPGLPKDEKSPSFEIDLTARWKNMWKPTSPADAAPGPADFGVIISQNHILQPDPLAQLKSNSERSDSNPELNTIPGSDLVPQLAKALAERNRIINTYSSSPSSSGKNIETKPPFVLIHLESFTKKANRSSSSFGFDDVVEKNYANGTIIYPTKNNPSILASTKFEFENLEDVENIFGRPLEGYHNGAMKPILPLGLADIRSYLKLMFEVHTDIHEGGKNKLDELRKLSISSPRTSFPNSREMEDWEIQQSRGMLNDNWLHTSSIGLRSLSGDHSSPQIPSPPIVTYGNANSLF